MFRIVDDVGYQCPYVINYQCMDAIVFHITCEYGSLYVSDVLYAVCYVLV